MYSSQKIILKGNYFPNLFNLTLLIWDWTVMYYDHRYVEILAALQLRGNTFHETILPRKKPISRHERSQKYARFPENFQAMTLKLVYNIFRIWKIVVSRNCHETRNV